jgi:methylase of polypeptide subunit release factors
MRPLVWLGRAWRPLSRSRRIACSLFGVDFPPVGPEDRYFAVTTPLLVRSAAAGLGPGSRVLDVGTGAFAVIGLALWRRTGCRVVSTDIHPRILERARQSVTLNRAPVRLVASRFLDALRGDFDAVTFNPPYVPSALAEHAAYRRPFDFQSDGGTDGTAVIAGFLDAFAERGGRATAYLAVNALLIQGERVLALVSARPRLLLRRTDRFPLWPFYVLVISRAPESGRA